MAYESLGNTGLVRALSDEYFLAFALRPESSFGKARYAMRILAPKIQAEL